MERTMEWIEAFNRAVRSIEEYLTEEVDHSRIAKEAGCSSYHFQRMFAYLAGIPLSEYVRRRKMSLAAEDLKKGEKVIDVALKYGYSSPTAFSRAFQSIHGVAPSKARNKGVAVKSYPPICFRITVKGVEEMEYRLEEKSAFRIVGTKRSLTRELEKNMAMVPGMWDQASRDGTVEKLLSLMEGEPKRILGISVCNDREEWRYYIAAASGKEVPEGMEAYEIPGRTWAVFHGEGECPGAIQKLEERIMTEWLPGSGYRYDDGPDVEVYLTPNPAKAVFEVWIPVKKR